MVVLFRAAPPVREALCNAAVATSRARAWARDQAHLTTIPTSQTSTIGTSSRAMAATTSNNKPLPPAQPRRLLPSPSPAHIPLPRQIRLVLLPPRREPVEQPQLVLRDLVERHLVLVLAPLLGEGADALVHPLVAVDLWAALGVVVVMVVVTCSVVLARDDKCGRGCSRACGAGGGRWGRAWA